MTTLKKLFVFGIILAYAGACILFGALIYEAFQKSLEWGLQVMGFLIFIIGIGLASTLYVISPTDCFKEKEK